VKKDLTGSIDIHKLSVHKKLMKFLVQEWDFNDGKLLDLGCGWGYLGQYLKDSQIEYTGIDIDDEKYKNAQGSGIKIIQHDLNSGQLPFAPKYFDYVVCSAVLEHVLNPNHLLSEMERVIKDDGDIIMILPNDYNILNRIRFLINHPLYNYPFSPHGHLHLFNIKQAKTFLTENGFKIVSEKVYPGKEPAFIPQSIRHMLSELKPSLFARVVYYHMKKR